MLPLTSAFSCAPRSNAAETYVHIPGVSGLYGYDCAGPMLNPAIPEMSPDAPIDQDGFMPSPRPLVFTTGPANGCRNSFLPLPSIVSGTVCLSMALNP